jgi:hypothetical protein
VLKQRGLSVQGSASLTMTYGRPCSRGDRLNGCGDRAGVGVCKVICATTGPKIK